MKYLFTTIMFLTLLASSAFNVQSAFAKNKKEAKSNPEQLLTRIDFGNSYISGQTLKSGSVYLLQRKKSEMKTMLKYREKYRKEILEAHGLHNPEIAKRTN